MKPRLILAACAALWMGIATGRGADDSVMRASKPEVRKEVTATIEAQLGAFRAKDSSKAYSYSATAMQQQMRLRAFIAIVQNNYPEIWMNLRAEFGLVRDDGTRATVLVHVFSNESDAAYDYVLFKERAGWRIGSVLRHDPRGADKV
jgi:hypothetical protein